MEPFFFAAFCIFVSAVAGAGVLGYFLVREERRARRKARAAQPAPPRAVPQGHGATSIDEAAEYEVVGEELPYARKDSPMTPAERDFFPVLCEAAPEGWRVFPQVRLGCVLKVQPGARYWKRAFNQIAQKSVDFVLCDPGDLTLRLVVELDDSSHALPDRQQRDAFVDSALRSAGVPVLHVAWQRRYNVTHLAAQIRIATGLEAPPLSPLVRAVTEAPPVVVAQPPRALATPLSQTAYSQPGHAPAHRAPASAPPQPARSPAPQFTAPRMACRRCDTEVRATQKFCPGCGAQLDL